MNLSDPIQYMRKPRVFLTSPRFGVISPDAEHSWRDVEWAANNRKIDVVCRREIRASNIVGTFSDLWGQALNWRDKGKADYFAMVHNDIEPESWWVDMLMAEMTARNAALISVVSPIKQHERLLSTNAWGREDDIWARELIPMSQIYEWPITFAPYQVLKPGQVMLFNTACWLCDLRHPAWDDFIFKQYARFVFDENGDRVCELMPEDWELSHFCHARKIPYLITRRVKLKHYGLEYWTNYIESNESPDSIS